MEIDTEVVNLLNNLADVRPELTFSKTLPVGVSKREHYDGFSEIIEIAKSAVYNATKRFVPNYMVCASDVLTVLSLNSQWKPVNTGLVNGPYMAGTFGSLKVFVSPALATGEYFIGVNGSDLMSSAAVYAPYMACNNYRSRAQKCA